MGALKNGFKFPEPLQNYEKAGIGGFNSTQDSVGFNPLQEKLTIDAGFDATLNNKGFQ